MPNTSSPHSHHAWTLTFRGSALSVQSVSTGVIPRAISTEDEQVREVVEGLILAVERNVDGPKSAGQLELRSFPSDPCQECSTF